MRGFTLIELLVVMAILGLLAALVAPSVIGRLDDAKVNDAKIAIKTIETALRLYKLDNETYPTTAQGLAALVAKPASSPEPKRYKSGGYLDRASVPLDPWGNPFVYISPAEGRDYEIISLGADGREGGEDRDADIKSSAL